MKTCTTCCEAKSLLDFNVKKSSPDGRATRCRACSKSAQTAYRAENLENLKERQTAYRKNNPDRLRERRAADYQKRAEYVKKKSAAWYVANKEKASICGKKRYSEKAEEIKQRVKRYRISNPEKIRLDQAKHRLKNTDKAKAYHAAWRAKNPAISKLHRQNRRARLSATTGKLSHNLEGKLFRLQKGMCACCKKPLGDNYHMDHIMPLALGGTNTDDNIQLLRAKCNMQKSAKHPIEFMQSRGFLL
jgi:acetyl/propionyl-CoA carboxylase alpha subunit